MISLFLFVRSTNPSLPSVTPSFWQFLLGAEGDLENKLIKLRGQSFDTCGIFRRKSIFHVFPLVFMSSVVPSYVSTHRQDSTLQGRNGRGSAFLRIWEQDLKNFSISATKKGTLNILEYPWIRFLNWAKGLWLISRSTFIPKTLHLANPSRSTEGPPFRFGNKFLSGHQKVFTKQK